MAALGSEGIVVKCAAAIYIPTDDFTPLLPFLTILEPRVLVLLDQQLGNKQPWKILLRSPKISDFQLNCTCLVDRYMAKSHRWCYTSFLKPIS